jgi:acetyl-CoA synthetase
MTYESVAIYLGIVRRGAVVVSVADSFAAAEIATRLRIGEAKAVFTQDVIARGGKSLPLYERVVEAMGDTGVRAVVLPAGGAVVVPLRGSDLSWDGFLAGGAGQSRDSARFCVRGAEEPTNVLFSSGTTGDPKAIPWTSVTPIKAAADAFAHHDVKPHDVVCWPTNLGWMMGPWLIYAALLNDATIALYQGSPLGRDFGLFVQDAGVTMLGVVPSLVKTWKGSGCMEGLDWSRIRCFSSTGEASTPHEMHWLSALAGYKPVLEYCGGTEIGGGYLTGTVVQPQAPSAFSTPALGCSFVILDDQGHPCDNGELALVPPLLGSSNRLLNRDHHESYFADMPTGPNGEVLRRHGDQVERVGGYYRALGRVDDTMNLGGIKTSSAELERVCNRVPGVVESAAIAVSPKEGGPSLLVLFVVSRDPESTAIPTLKSELQRAIAKELNPLFKVHDVVLAPSLPRTASNKVMRRVLRADYTPPG